MHSGSRSGGCVLHAMLSTKYDDRTTVKLTQKGLFRVLLGEQNYTYIYILFKYCLGHSINSRQEDGEFLYLVQKWMVLKNYLMSLFLLLNSPKSRSFFVLFIS